MSGDLSWEIINHKRIIGFNRSYFPNIINGILKHVTQSIVCPNASCFHTFSQ